MVLARWLVIRRTIEVSSRHTAIKAANRNRGASAVAADLSARDDRVVLAVSASDVDATDDHVDTLDDFRRVSRNDTADLWV